MTRIDTTRAAAIHYRCGSSGSGKSFGVKLNIKHDARLLVFDPDDEYCAKETERIKGFKPIITVQSYPALLDILKRYPRGALRVRWCTNGKDNFNRICKAAFAWGNCTFVAEEIAGVTTPSKAPDGWHTLVTRGRKRGLTIYAVTQRPSEADKTVLGNATTIRTGRLSRAGDRKYLAAEMDIDVKHVTQLNNLEYIETNTATMQAKKAHLLHPRTAPKTLE